MNNDLYSLHKTIAAQLAAVSSQPEQEAWWLLEKLTGLAFKQLLITPLYKLSPEQRATLDEQVTARVTKRMPLQYILGTAPFLDLTIIVQTPILIPRPETEEWADWLIQKLALMKNEPLKILDLCSGSGCIALGLAQALPNSTVMGIDINPQAIKLANLNKANNNLTNVEFMHSNLFESLENQSFDLIVSNPPYLAQSEWDELDPTVKQWEDRQALMTDNDGLALYEKISTQANQFLIKDSILAEHNLPRIVFEIGHTQANAVSQMLEDNNFLSITTHKDLSGKDRWVTAR